MYMTIDELKVLNPQYKPRSMSFEKFFGEMNLEPKQYENRMKLANALRDVVFFMMALVQMKKLANAIDESGILEQVETRFLDAVEPYAILDAELQNYIHKISKSIVHTTITDESAYTMSEDREVFIAENGSHVVMNHEEFQDAKDSGKKSKIWHTIMDNKERDSHAHANGQKVAINEPFAVGDSFLMYPGDTSLDADERELVNCRCSCEYV